MAFLDTMLLHTVVYTVVQRKDNFSKHWDTKKMHLTRLTSIRFIAVVWDQYFINLHT